GFFVSSRRRHTRFSRDWSSDVALPICEPGALGELIHHRVEITRRAQAHPNLMSGSGGCGLCAVGYYARGLRDVARLGLNVVALQVGRAACRERVEAPEGGDRGQNSA